MNSLIESFIELPNFDPKNLDDASSLAKTDLVTMRTLNPLLKWCKCKFKLNQRIDISSEMTYIRFDKIYMGNQYSISSLSDPSDINQLKPDIPTTILTNFLIPTSITDPVTTSGASRYFVNIDEKAGVFQWITLD